METSLTLSDIKEITPESFSDFRGEIYTLHKDSNSGLKFNHDKICTRRKDCLVGIHGDFSTHKLVSCLHGEIFCALVDNRENSKDYLKHKTFILSGNNRKQLLIPPGIGNSFFVLSDECVYLYKLSYTGEYVDHDRQFTLKWNDPKLNIFWPKNNPIISERDNLANEK